MTESLASAAPARLWRVVYDITSKAAAGDD